MTGLAMSVLTSQGSMLRYEVCRFALGSSSHPILSRAVVECVQQVTMYPALHSSPN